MNYCLFRFTYEVDTLSRDVKCIHSNLVALWWPAKSQCIAEELSPSQLFIKVRSSQRQEQICRTNRELFFITYDERMN